jgi:hypothetical protein
MIHLQTQTRDSLKTSVVHLHEKHENSKFMAKHGRYKSTQLRVPILQEILDKRYTLLPFTFYLGGQIGPLAATFLWSSSKSPSTCLKSTTRTSTNLTVPLAKKPHDISIGAYTRLGFLQKADIGWSKQHHNRWFTNSSKSLGNTSHWTKFDNCFIQAYSNFNIQNRDYTTYALSQSTSYCNDRTTS